MRMLRCLLAAKASVRCADSDGHAPPLPLGLLIAAAVPAYKVGRSDYRRPSPAASVVRSRVHLSRRREPLALAAQRGHVNIVRELVLGNASVNAQNKLGQTPLMLASCPAGIADSAAPDAATRIRCG